MYIDLHTDGLKKTLQCMTKFTTNKKKEKKKKKTLLFQGSFLEMAPAMETVS